MIADGPDPSVLARARAGSHHRCRQRAVELGGGGDGRRSDGDGIERSGQRQEVDVVVPQSGQQRAAVAVDHRGARRGGAVAADVDHHSSADGNVNRFGGSQEVHTPEQEFGHARWPALAALRLRTPSPPALR